MPPLPLSRRDLEAPLQPQPPPAEGLSACIEPGSEALAQRSFSTATTGSSRCGEHEPQAILAEEQAGRTSKSAAHTLEDLSSSFFLFALRVFHAWAFLLANVTIAGNGVNTFLNLFLEFSAFLSDRGRVLQTEDWSRIVHLICRAILLMLFFAGCMQRGWWLLTDGLELDMFINYRRTLCLEGPGPGDFTSCERRVELRTEDERRQVHELFASSRVLDRDLTVNGIFVPKGSQLISWETIAGGRSRGNPRAAAAPAPMATLAFRVDGRPAGFDGACSEKARACADVIFQCLIFLSLDVIPLALSIRNLTSLFDILSLQWLSEYATRAIWACLVHVLIYLVVSTLVDYSWKAVALRNEIQGIQGTPGSTSPPSSPSSPSPESPAPRGLEGATHSLGIRVAHSFRESGGRSSQDDGLSLCVLLRRLLDTSGCHRALLLASAAGLVSTVACSTTRHRNSAFLSGAAFLVAIGMLAYFRCRVSSRAVEAKFESFGHAAGAGPARSAGLPWEHWFRRHCGVSPLAVFSQELVIFLATGTLIVTSIRARQWGFAIISFPVFSWAGWVMSVTVCMADKVWICVLVERLLFGVVTLVVAASERHDGEEDGFSLTKGVWSALALILATQLGMRRQGKSHHSHAISQTFFLIIGVAIASLSLMASSSTTGALFGGVAYEWCLPSMPNCKEFQFPLHGRRNHSYEFCGLSWPMGSGDTVSDRCQDTRLSIVDFGQIATIAGFIPDKDKVRDNVEKYLPGWDIAYMQTYNITPGKHTQTTFIHLTRGSTTVIAVRGTSSAVEVLQDLNLWMRIAFLQLARKVGPSCYSTRGVLEAFTVNRTELMGKSFRDLADYVQGVVDKRTNATTQRIYLTGHSLGGGLATAVGAIVDIPAVTFSAPGLEATSAILQPSPKEEVLLRRGVNVMPNSDIVPMVDQQTGTTLRIECPLRGPLQCHRLRSTMCELLSACGDGGGRDLPRGYSRSCRACEPSHQSRVSPVCTGK